KRNILETLAERGNLDGKNVQAVIQIVAEGALSHKLRKIDVGGGHDANVHALRAIAAEAFEFLLLKDAQQLGLKFQRNVTGFIQVERLDCELVFQCVKFLERYGIFRSNRDLRTERLQQFHVCGSESIDATAGKIQCSKGAVAVDERHAANRLHAFGTKNVHGFTRVTVQFGAARKTRQPGGDGAARGRVFQGNNGVRLEDVLVGRKIEGVNSQCFRGGIKQGQAGVVVVNDALEAGNDAREKFGEFAARNQDVVDFEQHAETVALTRQLLLVGLRRFQIQRIVHRYRYLTGDALHELEFRVGDALRNGVPETHGPEPVLCRGQRNNRH